MGNCLKRFQNQTGQHQRTNSMNSGTLINVASNSNTTAAAGTASTATATATTIISSTTVNAAVVKDWHHRRHTNDDDGDGQQLLLNSNHHDHYPAFKKPDNSKAIDRSHGRANNNTSEISDNTLNKLFEDYKDSEEDMILAEGIVCLCQDLNYQPDEFAILVLAWCLDASQMCRFTRTEFIGGLHKMHADSIPTIRIRLEQTIHTLKKNSEMFKQLYRFTFRFGLEPDQRILALDMAISLWKLVFTVHTPIMLDSWINFLEQHPSIRGIPKDTWNMFLNFSEQYDIYNYDDTEAWPSLFDDFVDYEKARLATQRPSSIVKPDDDNNNMDERHQTFPEKLPSNLLVNTTKSNTLL